MGVPKQVADMEAEGDAEIAAEANAQGESPVQTQEVAPPKAPKADEAAPNGEAEPPHSDERANILANIGNTEAFEEAVRREVARKEAARESSTLGRVQKVNAEMKAQRESYEAKIAELEESIRNLSEKLERADVGNAYKRDDLNDDNVFAEIRKEYSEEDYSDADLKRFISVIKRVGSHDIQRFQKRFDDLDAERAERAKSAAKAEADAFVRKLEAEFPGFRKLDADNDPRWIKFLSSPIGGVMEDTTYGDVAKDALKQLNYRKFSSVVREFANKSRIVFSPNANPGDGTVASQIRPQTLTAMPPDSTKAQPRVVPVAEIEAFRKSAFAHRAEERYGLTREQVMERLRFYEDAEAEGRVR